MEKISMDTITINGEEYIKKHSAEDKRHAKDLTGMSYRMIRGDRSGVFVGYIQYHEGKNVTIVNARRIWYWEGAASLSQLATDGTSKPDRCKFPCEVTIIELTDVIEILTVTEKAKKSIDGVKVWEQ